VGWDKRGEAFRGASAMVVPSRSEPFGMVILEAMQYRVPVIYPIYPIDSGAAEVLENGIKCASTTRRPWPIMSCGCWAASRPGREP
jgi:glycosyltransferase involved in cell wall biosynthesis